MASNLLLIQPDNSSNSELAAHFESLSYHLRHATSVSDAVKLIDDHGYKPSAILVDILEINEKQMQLLEDLDESLGINEWVFLTYEMDSDLSERLEELSYRSIQQPTTVKRVEIAIKKAVRSTIVRRRLAQYSSSSLKKNSFDSIAGKSEVIQQHKNMLQELASVPMSTLLIKGETGSGKGHAASILHDNGLRCDYSLIEMNCAAMPKELVESQLFGHS